VEGAAWGQADDGEGPGGLLLVAGNEGPVVEGGRIELVPLGSVAQTVGVIVAVRVPTSMVGSVAFSMFCTHCGSVAPPEERAGGSRRNRSCLPAA
jgi:hypothetical protein